jgi:hypothetical protein
MNNLSGNVNGITQTIQEWKSNRNEDHLQMSLHNLEESTSLYSSVIDQQGIELAESAIKTIDRKTTLSNQLTNLVDAAVTLKKAVIFVQKEGTTLGATGFTIGAGLINLFSGNLLVGLPVTAIGLNEFKKAVDRYKNMDVSGSSGLVTEARTGVAMVQQMEEFQVQSLDAIDLQLGAAQEQLQAIENQIDEISMIVTTGSADLEIKKQEAYKLTQQAVNTQRQAIYELETGKVELQKSIQTLKEVVIKLADLISLAEARATDPDEIDHFISKAEQILSQVGNVQNNVISSADKSNAGLKNLRTSAKIYAAALEKYNETTLAIQKNFYEIQKKAQTAHLSKAKDDTEKAKQETAIANERAKTSKDILAEVDNKLVDLQDQLDNQFGTTSIVMGGIIGTAATPLISPLLIIPVAAISTAVTHYARRTVRLANNFFGKRGQIVQASSVEHFPLGGLKVQYSVNSTGWGGYLRDTSLWALGKNSVGSKTEGVIAINLGDAMPYIYNFNKNSTSKQGIMKENDFVKLDKDLRLLLNQGKISNQQVLDVIDSMKSIESEHGKLNLIAEDCVYLRDLMSMCRRNINNRL